jgi:hypothetical protein
MRKAGFVVLSISALLAVAVGAYVALATLVNSIYGYTSPLKGAPPVTEESSRPLTSQVVLILIDGLRFDASQQMPYLNALRKQGARAELIARPPSSSQAAWTTLLSGAFPETNGAPLFDPPYDGSHPISVDNLFAAAQRAGLTCGVSGPRIWDKLLATDSLYVKFLVDGSSDQPDSQVVDRARVFLDEFKPNLLLVHLTQVNAAGQRYGAASAEYKQAAQRCDDYVRTLAEGMNLAHSVLIVVSSHAQLDEGGYGGDEPELLSMPFVMAGEAVMPGDYSTMNQSDVAPTVAALLGAPTPAAAQGLMRLDMLSIDRVERAEALVALAAQRVRIGNVYVSSIGQPAISQTAEGDMQVARSSLQVKNYESAAELALLSVNQTGQEMANARIRRIWQSRRQRAVPLALLVLVPLALIWHWRGPRTLFAMLAAMMAAAAYHGLFLWQGNEYTFSRIPLNSLASTLHPSLVRAAICVGVGALVIVWHAWREDERSIFAVLVYSYGYGALLVYLVGLVAVACTLWNGVRFAWYVPNLQVAFVQCGALLQLMLVAALAIPLPIVIVGLQRLLLAIGDRYSTAKRHQGLSRKVAPR